jgi:menaquinone-dependent protoporphyrinogen oxidase
MAKILVVYGTNQGQTAKIAHFIAHELSQLRHEVDVYDSTKVLSAVRPEDYDAVLVGGSVHASGYQRPLKKWVKQHAASLSRKKNAFFSVCLGALQKDEKVQEEERKIARNFSTETGWVPERTAILAGGLPYTKYNWFLRRVMRNISAKAGGDIDTRQDYEYTDWGAVRAFAKEFGSEFPGLRQSIGPEDQASSA